MTSQPIRTGIAATAVAGFVALAGCGSDADKTATAETAAPTATPAAATPEAAAAPARGPVPAALRGRWARLIREADRESLVAPIPIGVWRADIGRKAMDGYAPRTDTVDFSPKLAVEGDRLTIGTSPACTSAGSYTWRATERRLTLAVTEDTCAVRAAIFGGDWTRQR